MSKEIKLTRGMVTIVDDEDYIWLSEMKWTYMNPSVNGHYAVRFHGNGRKRTCDLMHREIMKKIGHDLEDQLIDHKDRNGLNNMRNNLIVANKSINSMNRGIMSNNTSGYRGVSKLRDCNSFRAYISISGKQINLGCFKTAKEAAIAWNEMAAKLFGEHAVLNRID